MPSFHPLELYRARQNPPLSRAALGKLLKVSRETVWRWETGDLKPGPKALKRIADKTGVAPHELRPDLAHLWGGA